MSTSDHDPLLERLRAADPAQTLRGPATDRPRIAAALRRRTARRRLRAGSAVAVLALVATLATIVAPSGTPSYSSIVARAAQAATPPPGAILAVDAVIEIDGMRVRQRSWQRATAAGKPLTLRVVRIRSTDPREPTGSEYVSGVDASGMPFTRRYDPSNGEALVRNVGTSEGYLSVDRLYAVGRRASRHALVRTTIDGHSAYRLLTTRIRGRAGSRWRSEVFVDAKTFRLLAWREEARTPGSHALFRASVHVLSERKLPDTPQNRRLLRLRGPTH
jgi:hypothetical protein